MTVLERGIVLGTGPWGRLTPEQRVRLMRAAWALGIRRIDTAPSYGFGGVERNVLALWPGAIDTKVGLEPSRLQRMASPFYPTLHRALSGRSRRSERLAETAVVEPVRTLDDRAIATAIARLRSAPDIDLRTVWIHDPSSMAVGLAARAAVQQALELPADRCGLAWTNQPEALPPGVPLMLPFAGAVFDEPRRPTHWHGVIRFLQRRHVGDRRGGALMDEYLAGVLLRLPTGHRLVIGSHRPEHLDGLHRVAALCARAGRDRRLAAELDAAVRTIEGPRP